ncbi:vitamin K epoxide reductase family protein [Aliifodinibius sp. S!AR15-10]|uniref:vitamin K epoxide reductase family protein n=1 Tax=Aliifodinibius sp. S!AR15-10 TaxID=2950437 RepID=UPI0028599DC4|nr:vitamin K epoxide reductase family protein [Aliifodinibius sp. S!AR15-10]MDR8391271.1 vitamin K epoxide reductase family protein [Aliifodinibius sp. S!AR15-10]
MRSFGARLFGNLTLSDATASYFLFQALMFGLIIPLSGRASPYYGILGVLGLLALPVVFFSLYYQAVQIKVWCRLCLVVDAILLTQAGLFGYLYNYDIISVGDAGWMAAALTLLLLTTTCSGLMLVKNAFMQAAKVEQAEAAANRIKYDPDTFLHMLRRQKRTDVAFFEQEMLIGNPKTPLTLTMAASLSCGPCKLEFEQAARLIAAYPDAVNLAVRLQISSGNNKSQAPGIWLLGWWLQNIYGHTGESAQTKNLLRDWYESMDQKEFQKKYPLETYDKVSGAVEKLKVRHSDWMDQAEIKATPSFFINGYLLSKQYRIIDMMNLVPDIIDYFEQQDIKQVTFMTG